MSPLITAATEKAVQSSPYGGLTSLLGFIVLGLLLALLVEMALVDALKYRRRAASSVSGFDLAVWPLLFALLVFAGVQLAHLLKVI